MEIQASSKIYSVQINDQLDAAAHLAIDDKCFIVIDEILYGLYKPLFAHLPMDRLFILESTEENKVIETALKICERMTDISAKRNARLISLGGGIVQDITGFVASILYRGIHWTFFPTTLLAACDSCIGSKTSLNYKSYKNLLGTFYPPDDICICTPFFKTLSERDYKSGLGEVVKFHVMQGEAGIAQMETQLPALLRRDEMILREVVKNSLKFKKSFVEKDEFDRGERIKLNFAHTFGHAFETTSHYVIPHGTAVAMGTIVANRISLTRKWLAPDIVFRTEKLLQKIIQVDKSKCSLDMDQILTAIHKDKKQIGNSITAILLRGTNMELQVVHDVTREEIETAVKYTYQCID